MHNKVMQRRKNEEILQFSVHFWKIYAVYARSGIGTGMKNLFSGKSGAG